ncbi:MAG: UvrD-helicase domain-containing protein, partial [Candidatus Bipolaricaulota bacterium]
MTQGKINHIAIAASAGSGKTFQLAHRYIQLLAGGVPPDRIIALTFSRKAAGEIFESIARYLCEAISSPEQAQQMGRRIERTGSSQGDFLGLLRDLLDSSHRLHISTLDSFIVGIVSTFPMELGISSDFQVLDNDGAEAREAREEILRSIFDHRH